MFKKVRTSLLVMLAVTLMAVPVYSWIICTDVGTNNELIDNNTDDMIDFAGRGGTDNTDLRLDLDGTHPVISSPTDSVVEISGTAALNTVTIATALTINEDLVVALNAADEEIAINQTAVAGTANVPLIAINDDRTGATADVIAEASIWIDAEGVYAIAAVDGAISAEGGFFPAAANGSALGSAALEFADLFLADGAIINLGVDQDVKITHVADTGVLLNAAMQFQFRDSAIHISSIADSYLDITADGGIRLTGDIVQTTTNVDAMKVSRNIAEAGAAALVTFLNDHASNEQVTLLLDHDGTGGAAGYALHIDGENAAAPAVLVESGYFAAATPGVALGDVDTGFGQSAADNITIVTGGIEAMTFTEASSDVLVAVESDMGLTADVGSAQGNGVITSSYNVFTTVGTAGDAATLPAVFQVGTIVFIKNDAAANAMDVFPASGDDLRAGANTVLSLAASKGAIFIGTVANSTWTNMLEGI